jgi:DUF1365 family protein
LRHRRYRPRPHAFTYSLFMALIDVDHIDAQMQVSSFTSVNRFNWAAYDDRDHLGDPGRPLRARLRDDAAAHGVALPDGPLFLLTHLRYLGYSFNPISFVYAFDRAGRLEAVAGEVHNTFGGTCTYWLPRHGDRRSFHRRTPKTMHVSPFMGMDLDYEFLVTPPDRTIVAHMNVIGRGEEGDRPLFDATLTLSRRPWSAAEIRRVLVRHPFMTAKVIAAIHWEAARLWWKGLPSYPNPQDHPTGRAGRKDPATGGIGA